MAILDITHEDFLVIKFSPVYLSHARLASHAILGTHLFPTLILKLPCSFVLLEHEAFLSSVYSNKSCSIRTVLFFFQLAN